MRRMIVAAGAIALAGCEAIAGIQDLQPGPTDEFDASPPKDSPSYQMDVGSTNHDASTNPPDAAHQDADASVQAEAGNADVVDATTEASDAFAIDVSVPDVQLPPDSAPDVTTIPDASIADADASTDAPVVITTELIDDMESTNVPMGWIDGVNAANPRAGTWYVFDDGTAGGVLTPAPGTAASLVIAPIPGGRGTSVHAAHVTGNAGFTSYGAGMGFNLNAPSTPSVYNASAYQGFTFWARSGGAASLNVRFIVLDRNRAVPGSGGICDGGACNGAYGINFTITSDWQQYAYDYSQLTRPVFSLPDGVPFDPAHMIGCQWQVNQGVAFDLWVDDVSFIK
jgi:hypothetical protein